MCLIAEIGGGGGRDKEKRRGRKRERVYNKRIRAAGAGTNETGGRRASESQNYHFSS